TLGIVGLGHVGTLVAQRAHAFGMRIIACDPYVSEERAHRLGVELMDLDQVIAEADFLSLHVVKNAETVGMISAELLAKVKPGLRIINTSRGGIIDEDALADAISSGRVAGAGLDVFSEEPITESPLFSLSSVVVTPHLGASTAEAQDKAGVTIAEQVLLALAGDFVPFAVNVAARGVSEPVRPFMGLVEQLGRFFGCLHERVPDALEVEVQGALASEGTDILTLCALKGLFATSTEEPVSYVNVPQMAERRGLRVREVSTSSPTEYVNLVTLRSGGHSVAGTLTTGANRAPRIVMVDDHAVEVAPSPHMLVIRNDDRPGMIGVVGTVLGGAGISIHSMALAPSKETNTALMVLSVDAETPAPVLSSLAGSSGILGVHPVRL
ncbi:MAG TPA: NAD(P)-dependent oxidoreductase, partial [Acidimicrobiales bacterium]|nr:NAD(P)-dependent oxidoreductase [Acidimicrobiales bacterium]